MKTQPSKVEKLKTLLSLFNQASDYSNGDFDRAAKTLISFVQKTHAQLSREVQVATGKTKLDLEKVQRDLTSLKKECSEMMRSSDEQGRKRVMREVERLETLIENLPDAEALFKSIRFPELTGEQIVSKINSGDKKIRRDRIEGLEEEIKKLREELGNRPQGVRMGMRKIPIVKKVNLSNQLDGNTRAFKLPKDTVQVLGVWGTQFPVTFNDEEDFTFIGNTLTISNDLAAPETGQTLFCLVETLFYG